MSNQNRKLLYHEKTFLIVKKAISNEVAIRINYLNQNLKIYLKDNTEFSL